MLPSPLTEFLRLRRVDCNARFAAAKRHQPRLDGADFSLFLRDQLAPPALALESIPPDQITKVLDVAYDLGLQLVAGKLAGPAAVTPAINALWTEVFPSMAALIATAPRRLLGSLCNAAHHLAATPDTCGEFWRSRLVALTPHCPDASALLILAQVLAWRSGLAHFRTTALAAANHLPPGLALAALDAPPDLSWENVRDAHLADPWFGYDANRQPLAPAMLRRQIGAFRGFGGPFMSPPLMTRSGSQLLVRSSDEAWIVLADAFGATLHRATPGETAEAWPIARAGREDGSLPPGHTATSAVRLGGILAITSAQSHSIRIGPDLPDP